MDNKLYIGISGKMGSGKTTLSDGILNAGGLLSSTRVSLATPIKRLQDNIYSDLGLTLEGEKDRDLLIALGMWGRNRDPDFWLQQAILDMKLKTEDIIICDDIRFENEAEWFNKNGILMRIEGVQRGVNVDHNINNVTETALDDFSFKYFINNTVSTEDMIMQGLYAIAQHLNVSEELIDTIAQEVHNGKEKEGNGN